MKIQYNAPFSEDGQRAFQALQRAVYKALDRKRKLGQYAVVWDGEKPIKLWPSDSTPGRLGDRAVEHFGNK